jgi:hypothetical protein
LNSKSGASAREKGVDELHRQLNVCQEVLKNFSECTRFYQQFCTLLDALKVKCDRYHNDRKNAKMALET